MEELKRLLAETDAKIKRLEAQLVDLRSYRRGIEAALSAVSSPSALVYRGSGAALSIGGSATTTFHKAGRGLSATWQEVLRFIGREGKTIDEVFQFSSERGFNLERNNIRSQVSTMANKSGHLEKTGIGSFRLTEKGAEACGLSKSEGSDAPTSDPLDSTPLAPREHTQGET